MTFNRGAKGFLNPWKNNNKWIIRSIIFSFPLSLSTAFKQLNPRVLLLSYIDRKRLALKFSGFITVNWESVACLVIIYAYLFTVIDSITHFMPKTSLRQCKTYGTCVVMRILSWKYCLCILYVMCWRIMWLLMSISVFDIR